MKWIKELASEGGTGREFARGGEGRGHAAIEARRWKVAELRLASPCRRAV